MGRPANQSTFTKGLWESPCSETLVLFACAGSIAHHNGDYVKFLTFSVFAMMLAFLLWFYVSVQKIFEIRLVLKIGAPSCHCCPKESSTGTQNTLRGRKLSPILTMCAKNNLTCVLESILAMIVVLSTLIYDQRPTSLIMRYPCGPVDRYAISAIAYLFSLCEYGGYAVLSTSIGWQQRRLSLHH